MTNRFDSKGGPQPIAQGDNPIGQQNNYGVPYEAYGALAGKLAVTEAALASFFKILEEQQVPLHDLDSKLREIAAQHKELLASKGTDQAAKQAIKRGDYAKAEELLEDATRRHTLAAAEACAAQARLQRLQWLLAKAAACWQKAAALLPEESKKERSLYLGNAGYDLYRIGKYTEALPLHEQSLAIDRELGNKVGEGTTLSNIGKIYQAWGDYATALKYLEQSLRIRREIGDKAGEGATLNNLATIAYAKGDYAAALTYLEQSLAIRREIGDKRQEAETSWNIGYIYEKQGDLAKAEQYISRAVQLEEEIGHPDLEKDRKYLEELRAKLRGR
jgi:tetratricopeptide (TPR) repeat protein